jgi:mRNA-degrading endonuclease RelE of RelBE toxin-antitoxin system
MLYSITIHEDAERDLDAIWDLDEDVAAEIIALLEQAKNDQDLLEILTVKDFGVHGTEKIHVDKWVAQHKQGRNLWRVKIWELEGRGIRYRIIYALDPRCRRYHVLGVLERDFDYVANDDRTKRLLAAYDELGIPNY